MPQQPTRGGRGDAYGWRTHPLTGKRKFHNGDDTLGVGNYAPVTGTVVFAGWDDTGTGLGNAVGIREAANPDVIWWVAHHADLAVTVGQKVTEGTSWIGLKGSTGASAGPHAHTERRKGGSARPGTGTPSDPRLYYANISTTPVLKEEDDMPMIFKRDAGPFKGHYYTVIEGTLYHLDPTPAPGIAEGVDWWDTKRTYPDIFDNIQGFDDTHLAWLLKSHGFPPEAANISAGTGYVRSGGSSTPIDYDLLAQKVAALVKVPTVAAIADAVVDEEAERLKS